MTGNPAPTILFWVQHLLGVGHLTRAVALARAAAARGYDVHVANGGPPPASLDTDGVALHQLPALRSRDEAFSGLVDRDGNPASNDLWKRRQDNLSDLVRSLRPAMILFEHYPFGRRAFRHEIAGVLRVASTTCASRIAVSVRDILVARKAARWREAADFINQHVDAVFIHGDPNFVPLDETFPLASEVQTKLKYTGYVDLNPNAGAFDDAQEGEILVSSGGGNVGGKLRQAMSALNAGPDGQPIRVRVGAGVPNDAFDRLTQQAGHNVIIERNQPDYRQRLAGCACSVSQAGYNTIVDLLTTRAPAVLVPFNAAGETEQMHRARRLEDMGRAIVVPEAYVSPETLGAAIQQAMAQRHPEQTIALDGAETFAGMVTEMIGPAA